MGGISLQVITVMLKPNRRVLLVAECSVCACACSCMEAGVGRPAHQGLSWIEVAKVSELYSSYMSTLSALILATGELEWLPWLLLSGSQYLSAAEVCPYFFSTTSVSLSSCHQLKGHRNLHHGTWFLFLDRMRKCLVEFVLSLYVMFP